MRWYTPMILLALGCALPDSDLDGDGYSVAEGDCDDLVASVHPDADDAVADGIDQDCDGTEPQLRAEGIAHTCVVVDDNRVKCEGDETFGQSDPPSLGQDVVDMVAGNYHTCVLLASGEVACWGLDLQGQASPPEGQAPFQAIDAEGNSSMGQRLDGQWVCWGACLERLPRR